MRRVRTTPWGAQSMTPDERAELERLTPEGYVLHIGCHRSLHDVTIRLSGPAGLVSELYGCSTAYGPALRMLTEATA